MFGESTSSGQLLRHAPSGTGRWYWRRHQNPLHELEAWSLAAFGRHPADIGVGALHRAGHAVQAVRRAEHDLGVVPAIDLAGAEMSARVREPLGAAHAQRRVGNSDVGRLILTVDRPREAHERRLIHAAGVFPAQPRPGLRGFMIRVGLQAHRETALDQRQRSPDIEPPAEAMAVVPGMLQLGYDPALDPVSYTHLT